MAGPQAAADMLRLRSNLQLVHVDLGGVRLGLGLHLRASENTSAVPRPGGVICSDVRRPGGDAVRRAGCREARELSDDLVGSRSRGAIAIAVLRRSGNPPRAAAP